ncbi:hypothetical protein DFH08DRAFT_1084964 [Mycena albidolilacea]|uniref:Uncharacterized protein n=1 Tax=Mycena albidolilacea TaxID=1033008 RepID=A0AAD6ZKP5_9AGAR|nr:hypothetical protein DFH08DRAFT_1084964 [Mycena albidolilacea]
MRLIKTRSRALVLTPTLLVLFRPIIRAALSAPPSSTLALGICAMFITTSMEISAPCKAYMSMCTNDRLVFYRNDDMNSFRCYAV